MPIFDNFTTAAQRIANQQVARDQEIEAAQAAQEQAYWAPPVEDGRKVPLATWLPDADLVEDSSSIREVAQNEPAHRGDLSDAQREGVRVQAALLAQNQEGR